jgi:hypothetical protein
LPSNKSESEEKPQRNSIEIAVDFTEISTLPALAISRRADLDPETTSITDQLRPPCRGGRDDNQGSFDADYAIKPLRALVTQRCKLAEAVAKSPASRPGFSLISG